MTIIIKDLEMNIELDKAAMKSILGGWKNSPTSKSSTKFVSPGRSSWANYGSRLTQHRLLRNVHEIT